MPLWPGPALAIGGALLAVAALAVASMAVEAGAEADRIEYLGWLALAGTALFGAGLVYAAARQVRLRRRLPVHRYRGPSILLMLALVLLLSAVATAPFGEDVAALMFGDGRLTLLGAAVILTATQAALLLVSWAFVVAPRAMVPTPPSPPGPWPAALVSGIGWGVVAWVGASLVAAIVVLLLGLLGFTPDPDPAERAVRLLDPWLVVGAVVLLAPVAEELFFRGIVFNAWLRERGVRWAYLGSAALFAVIHASVVALLPIFLLGLALAWVYRRSGNLLAPIAMHATVNGISVTFALLARYDVIHLPG